MNVVTHSDRAFTLRQLVSPAECGTLITLAESKGFAAAGVRTNAGQAAMPQIRNNDRVVFAAPQWTDLLWQRLRATPLPELEGEAAHGLPKDLRFYRYSPGQRFKMHKDGPWHEDAMTSRLTLLLYLNHNFEGGDTVFRGFSVTPRAGDALLFIHDTWHEGALLATGTKYVLRSDVLYRPKG